MRKIPGAIALMAATIAIPSIASANLILISPTDVSGAGLGAVNTVLTLQNNGTESGCVGFGGTTGSTFGSTNCTGSSADVKTGASQTKPLTLGAIGSPTASSFRVVLNAAEPGNTADNSIRLNTLAVQFYNSAGSLLFNSVGVNCGASNPTCTFTNTFTGVGNAGFTFGLDAAQQLAATSAGAFASASNVIGLSTQLSLAAGGPETFFFSVGSTSTPISVSEPSSLMLLGVGMVAVGIYRRRQTTT